MRKRLASPLLALSLILTGCGSLSGCAIPGGSVAEQAPETVLAAEKTLTVAHLALASIGNDLIALSASGTLRGNAAATAKVWYDRADDALRAADAADRAANAQGILEAVRLAQDAIFQANAIIAPLRRPAP